ncbi:hypothetical protein F4861DRAFT_544627, partial [Xylaria intraflava]
RASLPIVVKEIKSLTGLDARVIAGKVAGEFTVILPKKVAPFRVLGSEPASSAAICGTCGVRKASHQEACRAIPQCPNCLGPLKPGHPGCPCFPKVKKGSVHRPSHHDLQCLRNAGKAAFRAALLAHKKATAPAVPTTTVDVPLPATSEVAAAEAPVTPQKPTAAGFASPAGPPTSAPDVAMEEASEALTDLPLSPPALALREKSIAGPVPTDEREKSPVKQRETSHRERSPMRARPASSDVPQQPTAPVTRNTTSMGTGTG